MGRRDEERISFRPVSRIVRLFDTGVVTNPDDPVAMDHLQISQRRDVLANRPVLIVELTNRSQTAICIRVDALEPDSGEMIVRMRDSNGRSVRYQPPGLMTPPLEGTFRLEPGASVRRPYYLDIRFILQNRGVPFPEGMRAQSSVRYGICDDVWSLRATSAWQPI